MKGKNCREVLVAKAGDCARRTGIPVQIIIDNSPIDHCFFREEARRLGFPIVEKTSNEKMVEAVKISSIRLNGG